MNTLLLLLLMMVMVTMITMISSDQKGGLRINKNTELSGENYDAAVAVAVHHRYGHGESRPNLSINCHQAAAHSSLRCKNHHRHHQRQWRQQREQSCGD